MKELETSRLKVKDFTYNLPDQRIAKYPLSERDSSKLLVFRDGNIAEDIFKNIDKHLPENSLLIFNNTKVIQARLNFKNSTGAGIEIFCLHPSDDKLDPSLTMSQAKGTEWVCFVGRAVKWKEKTLSLTTGNFTLNAEIIGRNIESFKIRFFWNPPGLTFAEILDEVGEVPIPPYLNRDSEEIDLRRYQTVYAEHKGSVAAPTAGLHFTQKVFDQLASKSIRKEYLTLHVGAGTFKPIKSETIAEHEMHFECIEISEAFIEKVLNTLENGKGSTNITAVGTTSLRTIETLYWMGVKAHQNLDSDLAELEIRQWDPYLLPNDLSSVESIYSLLQWLRGRNMKRLLCKTQILIAPGYVFKIVDSLITNFHQPNSTLLLLVAALIGDEWKKVYAYALNNDFRFLSYGDGSLLFKTNHM